MVIRIKRKLYFKPRLCPDCGKPCLFCKHYLAQRCKKCHEVHCKKRHNRKGHLKRRALQKLGKTKYTKRYFRIRKHLLKEHPFCSLCGSETQLTVHHVGGGCEHYTVLCDTCHQAYERWNNKRKAKKCIRRIGIRQIIRSIRDVLAGMSWRIRIKLIRLKISKENFERLNLN